MRLIWSYPGGRRWEITEGVELSVQYLRHKGFCVWGLEFRGLVVGIDNISFVRIDRGVVAAGSYPKLSSWLVLDDTQRQLDEAIRWLEIIADGTCDHRQGLWCSHCRAQKALKLVSP